MNDLLLYYCTCCFNPTLRDEDEEFPYPISAIQARDPALQTATGRDIPPISIENNQDNVPQSQLHAVSWEEEMTTPVDLTDIDGVNAIVRRPVAIIQSESFAVVWEGTLRGPKSWGGDEEMVEPAAWEKEDGNNRKKSEQQAKSLPLPWEGQRETVPLNGDTTTGYSQEQPETDDDAAAVNGNNKAAVVKEDNLPAVDSADKRPPVPVQEQDNKIAKEKKVPFESNKAEVTKEHHQPDDAMKTASGGSNMLLEQEEEQPAGCTSIIAAADSNKSVKLKQFVGNSNKSNEEKKDIGPSRGDVGVDAAA